MNATITAVALEVACPACHAPQPNADDGSHLWTPAQVNAITGTSRDCNACQRPFRVRLSQRVRVA